MGIISGFTKVDESSCRSWIGMVIWKGMGEHVRLRGALQDQECPIIETLGRSTVHLHSAFVNPPLTSSLLSPSLLLSSLYLPHSFHLHGKSNRERIEVLRVLKSDEKLFLGHRSTFFIPRNSSELPFVKNWTPHLQRYVLSFFLLNYEILLSTFEIENIDRLGILNCGDSLSM